MQFFIDSAEVEEIRALNACMPVEGVTTNPSLILKSGRKIEEVLEEICSLIGGPVSAEVTAEDYDNMMRQADILAKLADNICIKLPMTADGLRACREITANGHKTNMTLCFSANQALLAAKANAAFVSPFIGRLIDNGGDGLQLIADIRKIYDFYGFGTKILAASLREPGHVSGAALAGADCATLPPQLMRALVQHPLTDKGISAFAADWAKTGQIIGG
ncbi:MAG: fructose-6-phosphate aldolase [Candidatus Tokpelaia sp.]|uniref:fructose-6-phosphate aldolase n=1 Tax=Candidatus Tokpelaia sp. TaxID=2233777 RepID=UPI0012388842|nr:fructose-6-phosphate aldolase [Candidatus Tokpelaia sp.]KAA6205702.1 MAG: fructose-6-phosphate aldolase [Candidatus Tokpelaia sp.]KAA6207459.1 MAG: fructose-6-phosphate aldolase [Candidatus Tokpelaia sp.]KAA6405268.1 fructose-6-phosphate aldolase [Candidatus Tokpelaia sp.]